MKSAHVPLAFTAPGKYRSEAENRDASQRYQQPAAELRRSHDAAREDAANVSLPEGPADCSDHDRSAPGAQDVGDWTQFVPFSWGDPATNLAPASYFDTAPSGPFSAVAAGGERRTCNGACSTGQTRTIFQLVVEITFVEGV